jgi:sugar phosphate isomerase/epimerase
MLLLSTVSFAWYGLHRIFDFAKESKYDWIELVLNKKNFDFWDEEYVYNLSKKSWVPVLSIQAPKRGMNEKTVDIIVSLALKLWAQNITFTPPHYRDKSVSWYLRYLSKVKRDTHLSISIENVEPRFAFFFIPEYKDATLMQIKKVTWDTSLDLSAISPTTWSDILKVQKILGNSIKNISFSDTHWPKKGLLPGQAWWGTSYLPLESFLMKLKASSYNNFITLEISPRELWVWTNEKITQSLDYFKKYFTKHF